MTERKSQITHEEKCPTCGTTSIKFDPPLVFNLVEACGVVKPGTYASGEIVPSCDTAKGHEGNHIFLLEKLIEWPNS